MNWLDITFKQYIDIDAVVKDTELGDDERALALCQAVYGINLLAQPMSEYARYMDGLSFLKTPMPDMFLNDTYTVNGTVYEFHRNIKDLTVGQFMDYQNYAKGEKSLDTYASILTIFMIPQGCKYNEGYDIVKARKDMLDLPAPVALSLSAFFLGYWNRCIRTFLRYSTWKVMTAKGMSRKEKRRMIREMREMAKQPPTGGA